MLWALQFYKLQIELDEKGWFLRFWALERDVISELISQNVFIYQFFQALNNVQ